MMVETKVAQKSVFELADELRELKVEKTELESRLKQINKEIERVDAEISQAMVEEELQSFNRNGYTFYLSTITRASSVPETRPQLLEWFKENGLGDMVHETVNAQTLSAWVREQLENDELPEEIVPFINIYEKTTCGMRKAPKK